MPALRVDLEDTAGTRQGSGPLTSVSNVRITRRLSKAGTVAFDVPAADPKAALLIAKRVARVRSVRAGASVDLGAGIVDSITVRGRGSDPPLLTVAGDDLLSELANRRVLNLTISDGSGGPVAIATALASIMALAPAGWTIDTATYTTSSSTVYHQFGNETVLAALIWVANALGEQFRLGTGREVVWLYKQQPASGLRAIQTGDPVALAGNTSVVLIESLDEVQDTHATVTRIYPYGAGNATARVTLEHATWSAPGGYAIDTVNNFIKYTAADTANRIDDVQTYNAIAEIGTAAADRVSAANQLAVATYEDLRRRIVAVKTYRSTVTKVDAAIQPGATLRVQYRRTIGGYVAVNINADLVVLEVATSFDTNGIASAALTLSTVDLWPASGASVVQNAVSHASTNSSTTQVAERARTADAVAHSSLTAGSIPFVAAGALTEDNANLFWDDASNFLGLGTNVPNTLLHAIVNDALTSTSPRVVLLGHNTSGTPAASFGEIVLFQLESDTTADRNAARIVVTWVDPTDATRKARVVLGAYDSTTVREAIRYESSGTAALLGVLGAAAVARQVVTGSRGGNAALASLLTALANFGFITDSTTA